MIVNKLFVVGFLGVTLVGCSSDSNTDENGNGGTTDTGGTTNNGGNGGTISNGGSGGTISNGGTAGTVTTGGTGGTVDNGGTGGTTGGSGGTVDNGGTGGATGGTGGTADNGGTGGASGRPSGPSEGCMKDLPGNEPLGNSVLHTIDITGMAQQYVAGYTHRKFCTTIPNNYNPATPYPVVFYGPGCGATACEGDSFTGRTDVFIVQAIAGADAKDENIVPRNGSPGCFQAGKEGTADSPEGPYFDQVMAQVEATYCIDKGKIFAAGTSSGAWLSNYLACARGNVIRGTAADSGGLQDAHPPCTGGAAVMEFPGDSANETDQEGHNIGSAETRDMFIQLNGCSTTATTMTIGNDSCQVYGGCSSPVVWCDVGGGHQAGNGHLSPTGWAFWSSLQ